MDKKKFLIISQAIFPAQFPRSFRATELAKELGRQGHTVILYAVLGKYDYSQFEIENPNIIVKDIGRMYFAKMNSDESQKFTLLDKVLTKILKKIVDFPDIEFLLKIPPVLRKEKDTDCLITVGKPFAIHWGAALYKRKINKNFPKIWIADCGDPYMGNNFNKPLFHFKYLEKWFCRKVDFLTIPFEGARNGYYKEFHKKIKIIPQGFKFDEISLGDNQPENNVITFVYAGVFYKGKRDPQLFLEYLTSLESDFKFLVFTKTKTLLEPFLPLLEGKLEIHDYIPRAELLKIMNKADFLINIENESQLQSPSKLIDYALTGRPILSIKSLQLDKELIDNFLKRNYTQQYKVENLQQYNIKNVALEFCRLANSGIRNDCKGQASLK